MPVWMPASVCVVHEGRQISSLRRGAELRERKFSPPHHSKSLGDAASGPFGFSRVRLCVLVGGTFLSPSSSPVVYVYERPQPDQELLLFIHPPHHMREPHRAPHQKKEKETYTRANRSVFYQSFGAFLFLLQCVVRKNGNVCWWGRKELFKGGGGSWGRGCV